LEVSLFDLLSITVSLSEPPASMVEDNMRRTIGQGGLHMRFIHTSDWHLGRRLQTIDLIEFQRAFLDWLLSTARALSVDAVVVSGDIYDRSIPPTEAVDLLDRTVASFASAGIPILLIPGNHDHPVRLRYGGALFAQSGIHVRAEVATIADPVILRDADGEVGFYGIPYLVPDAVRSDLGAERSHESVLAAAVELIRRDAHARDLGRIVVASHAFITGGEASDSEREIRVGGVGDAPAGVFDGITYVALGHLHGPQVVSNPSPETVLAYSGSPMAFSFSERDHEKSVRLVDIDAAGAVTAERVPTPVPRRLRQVRGRLVDLLCMADQDDTGLADAWLKVVLTDSVRPESPMAKLREVWPHTIALEFEPEVDLTASAGLVRFSSINDPVDITADFYTYVTGSAPDGSTRTVIEQVVEATAPENVMR
jgi:exonuclease SbcD